ncbi:cytochrome P450 82C4-like [Papaver somniferum]|nr:cytochrome P450 82C4-like [Papaver somniferum]
MSDSNFDADTIIKATCQTMMVAGSDTLMVTLVWVLSLLVNHPDILQKVHEEMDIHVGRERQVDESDIKNLLYLQAATKETLRLYPPGPIMTRESTEDCTLLGYHIPAATRLIVNISKVQRDPQVWTSASEFKPERFLAGGEVDVSRDHSFQFMPFGGGRRSCPGTSLALQVVHLALARLIHGFDFKTPSGEPTDMTESPGLTNVKATPLDLLVTPRLSPKLYTC